MTQTTSPHDTGEIELGGATRDLSGFTRDALLNAPTFRRPNADETGQLEYHPQTIGIVDFEGPQQPVPIPVPPTPSVYLAAAQPLFPLERVITPDEVGYVARHRAPLTRVGRLIEIVAVAWDRVKSS